MKIYLLNPPFLHNYVRCGRWAGGVSRGGGLDYPKWLAYATGMLEKDFNIKLVDAPANDLSRNEVIEDVKKFRPDLIVSETNFSSLTNDAEITLALKQAVGAKTVLVGPPMALYSDNMLQNFDIDITARLEYDMTLCDLASVINEDGNLRMVKGISFKENGHIINNPNRELTTDEELNSMPFVSRTYKKHLNIKDYYLSQSLYPVVQIFAGRGCPFKCTFCSWPKNLMGRKYRSRSSNNIADEFEYIDNELPEVREIFIEDDTFTLNKKLVQNFCLELKERNIDITWSCNARATLDYATMKDMKDAGCRLIIVGYESGCNAILKNIKKDLTKDQSRIFTKNAKKANLLIHGDFVIGLPGETRESANETLDFINELKPNILQLAVATPIPGTDFYNYVKENGYLLSNNLEEGIDKNGYQKCIVSYPDFSKEDIEYFVFNGLKKYYLTPSFIPTALRNILRKDGIHELKTMIMSAKLFFKYMGENST